MLKLPRRRPSYYSSSYYRPTKRSPRVSLLWVVLSLPVLLVLLEILARVYLGWTGKASESSRLSPLDEAYRLQFLTAEGKPIQGLAPGGSLAVTRHSLAGYQLLGQQKNPFLQINQQGFRDTDPLPLAKPKNEIRIFLLGGSTAFGQGNEKQEETISHQLETLLQQRVAQQKRSPQKYRPDVFPFFKPDRQKLMGLPPKIKPAQYRVINAAVPGYASGNELAQFALKILPYQPDSIVILDGYADLMLPSQEAQADIPKIDKFLEDAPGHFKAALGQSFKGWTEGIALLKVLPQSPTALSEKILPTSDGKFLAQYLPKDAEELKKRVLRHQENHRQIVQLTSKLGIPTVIAIQPEITGRPVEKLSDAEKVMRNQLGKEYLEQVPKAYSQLVQTSQQLAKSFPKTVKTIDLYQGQQNWPTPSFSDPIHLTAPANRSLAERLYATITSWEKIQIIPQNFYLKD